MLLGECKNCTRKRHAQRRAKQRAEWGEPARPWEMSYEPPTELAPVHPLEETVARGAACRGLPSLFLADHPDARRCSEVCAACPVREECRTVVDHIEDGVHFRAWTGYWAGETLTERARRRGTRISTGVRFYREQAA